MRVGPALTVVSQLHQETDKENGDKPLSLAISKQNFDDL